VAPGIFLIGYNIGTGSVTTMASAGARYGMGLTWTLVVSCLITLILMLAYGRYTLATGETAVESYRKHIGRWLALTIIVTLVLSEIVSSMGVMGIISSVVYEWSSWFMPGGKGVHPLLSAAVFGAILYWLFWVGRQSFFEKALALFVAVMGLSFLLSMFIVIPDPWAVAKGMVPSLPGDAQRGLFTAGMVGTTVAAPLFVIRTILLQERGWGPGEFRLEVRDAVVSVSIMLALSVAVMACAAGTFYPRGEVVEKATDMIRLLEPIAGRGAVGIFVIGIIGAGLSSLFPIYLMGPWLISDYRGVKRRPRSAFYRVCVLLAVLCGFVVPILGKRPVMFMVASQAFCVLALPLVVGAIIVLYRKAPAAKRLPLGPWLTTGCAAAFLFSLYISYIALVGLLNL
jgi:Mn2+/Fe2+ NRAMP family transporter